MSEIARRLRSLSPEKRKLLAARMRQEGLGRVPEEPIPRGADGGPVPLSLAQERLWFLSELDPLSIAYHVVPALRLRGPLAVAALESALREVVRRHAALRTVFTAEDGRPRMTVVPEVRLPFTFVDLAAVAPGERGGEARRVAEEHIARPFDLAAGPCLRALLLELDRDEHALVIVLHHIVSDGWSRGVLMRELFALYAAAVQGAPSPLAELPIQYADFALWQRRRLEGGALDRQLDYWKERLVGAAPLELPGDRPRSAAASDAGRQEWVALEPELSDGVRELSRGLGVTPFMTLLAAFTAFLGRVTGQSDIPVGTVTAGRERVELEGLIGFFVNTLVLRTDLAGDPPFEVLVGRVRETCIGAWQNQDAPFDRVVDAVRPARGPGRTPLLQVGFDLHTPTAPAIAVPGLAIEPWAPAVGRDDIDPFDSVYDTRTAKFDLLFGLGDTARGIAGIIEYSTERFDRSTILRFWRQFATLLRSAVAAPATRLSRLALIDADERQQLVERLNDRPLTRPPEAAVHRLFEAQAARAPAAVAVVHGAERLTYGELERRANQLAHALVARGVGRETRVGVWLERGVEMVVAVLGVLKAGGAYVPLDPGYPRDRLGFMIEDSDARLLISSDRFAASLPRSLPRLLLESLDGAGGGERGPQPRLDLDDLAYVIYTSGSTGRPKGVMVSHSSLATAYAAWEQAYDLARVRSHLQMASFSFDVCTGDLVRALCSGARLVICPAESLLSGREMHQLMLQEEVECGDFVPAVARNLADHLEEVGEKLDALRIWCVGADVWHAGEHRRFAALCGAGTRLINSYGVTEATIDSAYLEVLPEGLPASAPVPIGGPYPGTRLYVLDRTLEPVPIGVAGELCIGGPGVARGYHKDPALTAARFVPDPFAATPGSRLYRTGDRARTLPGLEIDFLGRVDRQVKLRGFRIEPGEIESVLATHPGVRRSAVVVAGDRPGQERLVAYLVASPEVASPPAAAELKAHLRAALPEFMVPAAYVFLDAIPLTPNGKVDRTALPPFEHPPAAPTVGRDATAADLEGRLRDIWCAVLGVESIDRDDDFFDLGGHSLLATQVVSRVRRELGVEIRIRDLFESPTVAGLAARVAAMRAPVEESLARIWREVLGTGTVGRDDDFFDLGGHSLLATQVVSRARRELGVEIRIRDLFEAPTVAGLAAAIAARPRVAAAGGEAERDVAAIVPVPRDRDLPLSFSQLRLWFLEQLRGATSGFNVSWSIRLAGDLDLEALRRAVEEIRRRHEALRTTFADRAGVPYQVVAPPARFRLPLVDLAALPEPGRAGELARLVEDEQRLPFDIRSGPLLRARLVRLGAADHVLLITAHSLVFDGWSGVVFHRELSALYAAFRRGLPSPLAALAIQYADFAAWQQGWLAGAVLDRQLGYWREQLGQLPPPLELPADRPRSTIASHRGDTVRFSLPPALHHRLSQLGRTSGATLFMTAAAALATLLGRLSGQTDVALGTFVANRNRIETEGLIGFFVNTLVLRARLDGDPSFREVLARVRESALGAYAHQDLPFERLLEALQPDRDPGTTPLFQVALALENFNPRQSEIDLEGIAVGAPERRGEAAHFDLSWTLNEVAEGIEGELLYATDRFTEDTARRMVASFRVLLEAAVADPDRRIGRLPVMEAAERHRIVVEWNDRRAAERPGVSAHELIEATALRIPDAVAVVAGGDRITYRELDRRADRLARLLRRRGVGPEQRVGLCTERGIDMAVGMLAILKAGGAFVPLDPNYPADRLSYMMADAATGLVLTTATTGLAPGVAGREVLAIDLLPPEDDGAAAPPGASVTPDNLAYVIYTSGSTGRPKGVMVSHRSWVSSYRAWEQDYALDQVRAHLQMASLSFDVCAGDFIRALGSGGRLVVCPQEILLSAGDLHDLMRREAVDFAEFVPAVMRNLLPYLEAGGHRLDFMRLLCVGSDVWSAGEYRRIRALCGAGTRLVNSFGVTEAAIDSTYLEELPAGLGAGATVPIGRPFAGVRVHVLDRSLEPQPIGARGELYIGGPGVARGYLGRPDVTAARFVPDPFADGARLYRTGDLARYRADGNIDFLGRADDQVKIRGVRIEPGEIESAIARHPGVGQTIVVARPGPGGDARLVAYLTASTAGAPPAAELRAWLKRELPDLMLPSAFVVLDALPLTPNGKIDRLALPEPAASRPDLEPGQAMPHTPVEQVVAGVWAAVLGVERVGLEDDFFALGGHSLLATQVVARLREALAPDLRLRTLFLSPTVSGLAAAILADESRRPRIEKTARALLELARLSDDEVRGLLDAGGARRGETGEGGT